MDYYYYFLWNTLTNCGLLPLAHTHTMSDKARRRHYAIQKAKAKANADPDYEYRKQPPVTRSQLYQQDLLVLTLYYPTLHPEHFWPQRRLYGGGYTDMPHDETYHTVLRRRPVNRWSCPREKWHSLSEDVRRVLHYFNRSVLRPQNAALVVIHTTKDCDYHKEPHWTPPGNHVHVFLRPTKATDCYVQEVKHYVQVIKGDCRAVNVPRARVASQLHALCPVKTANVFCHGSNNRLLLTELYDSVTTYTGPRVSLRDTPIPEGRRVSVAAEIDNSVPSTSLFGDAFALAETENEKAAASTTPETEARRQWHEARIRKAEELLPCAEEVDALSDSDLEDVLPEIDNYVQQLDDAATAVTAKTTRVASKKPVAVARGQRRQNATGVPYARPSTSNNKNDTDKKSPGCRGRYCKRPCCVLYNDPYNDPHFDRLTSSEEDGEIDD